LAVIAAETSTSPYRHDLDLTGFIDGTENPTLTEAPEVVLAPDGAWGPGNRAAPGVGLAFATWPTVR
jgi:deferrochelatase/peroxidase EfeB